MDRRVLDELDDTEDLSDFASIPDAIAEFKAGRFVLIVDDEDRENEGDLAIAAEFCGPTQVNFMAREGRGLICMPMLGRRLDELNIPMMVVRTGRTDRTGRAAGRARKALDNLGAGGSRRDGSGGAAREPAGRRGRGVYRAEAGRGQRRSDAVGRTGSR